MAYYKRRIYLINPKFQLKFSLYVCIILFISSLIYPVTIYDLMSNFSTYLAKYSPASIETFNNQKENLIFILVLWQLGFTSLVFIICIFFSHKIAGPLYKTTKYLSEIRSEQNIKKLFFRKGDYFQELATEFNETFEHIQENYKKDFVYISEVSAYLNNLSIVVPDDKKVIINEINKKLSEIQNRFNKM